MTFSSATTSKGTYNPNTGIWDIGNLNINESTTLKLTIKVINRGTLINTAEITSENEYDPSENIASQISINVT